MNSAERLRSFLVSPGCAALLVAVFFSMWLVLPIIESGWFKSHDGLHYPYLSYRFVEALSHGVLYPRWMPEMAGGYGYPVFLFYQPAYFYFSAPFVAAFGALPGTYVTLFILLVAGALGGYVLARRFAGPWLSVALSVVYLFSPYIATNLFRRGDFSELMGQLLVPWGLVAAFVLNDALRANRSIFLPAIGLLITTVLIVTAHPFVAFFYIPLLLALLAVLARGISKSFQDLDINAQGAAAIAGGLGGQLPPTSTYKKWNVELLYVSVLLLAAAAAITAPYWVPLFQLKYQVTYQAALASPGATLNRLTNLDRALSGGWARVGVYQALGFLGLLLAWKKGALPRVLLFFMLLLTFLTTEYSRPLWEFGYGVLRYIQFPFRQLAVNSTVHFIGIIYLVLFLREKAARWPRLLPIAACVMLAVVLAFSYQRFYLFRPLPKQDFFAEVNQKERETFLLLPARGEFRPRGMNTRGLKNRIEKPVPIVEFVRGTRKENTLLIDENTSIFTHRFTLTATAPTALILNQFYLPGWVVEADGVPVPFVDNEAVPPEHQPLTFTRGENGRIRLDAHAAGTYRFTAWYDGPPHWRIRNFAAMVALALCGVMLRWRRTILSFLKLQSRP